MCHPSLTILLIVSTSSTTENVSDPFSLRCASASHEALLPEIRHPQIWRSTLLQLEHAPALGETLNEHEFFDSGRCAVRTLRRTGADSKSRYVCSRTRAPFADLNNLAAGASAAERLFSDFTGRPVRAFAMWQPVLSNRLGPGFHNGAEENLPLGPCSFCIETGSFRIARASATKNASDQKIRPPLDPIHRYRV